MRLKNRFLFIWLSAMALVPALAAATPVFGDNLIVNGDAEADAGSPTGDQIGPVTGFVTTGTFTEILYAAGGGYPSPTDPGPADRGLNFFGGGPSAPLSTATQTIALSPLSSSIDTGSVAFDLSGDLGGFLTQGDNAVLSVSFLSGADSLLGSASIGPVTDLDRSDLTGLLYRQVDGFVPTGTRSAEVTLVMTKLVGYSNDGYADNLSLVLSGGAVSAVPEPDTSLCLAVGLGALGLRRIKASRQGRANA